MGKHILLVNTNTFLTLKIYPIALDYLISILSNSGYNVDSLDLVFADQNKISKILKSKIRLHDYLAICISIRNIHDELIHGKKYLPEIFALVKNIRLLLKKYNKKTKIILGGSGFSLMPQTILKKTGADYGVVNEGENALVNLLKLISQNKPISKRIFSEPVDISNLQYKRGSWGHFHEYFKQGVSGNLQTKRGCPMKCLYCEYPLIEGKRFRFRNPDIVAQEFLQLEQLGFPRIYIVDATFNNPPFQAKEILRAFVKTKTTKPWTAFFNPKFIDQELLDLISQTNGGNPLKLTIESGSNIILKNLQKNFLVEDILKTVKLCNKNKIPFSFTVLFGGPGETKQTVKATCDLIKKTHPQYVSMNIGIFLHPQTPLAITTQNMLWKKESDFVDPIMYPCKREEIKKWVTNNLSLTNITYNLYEGSEN